MKEVVRGMGYDKRINAQFLQAEWLRRQLLLPRTLRPLRTWPKGRDNAAHPEFSADRQPGGAGPVYRESCADASAAA